MCCMCVCVFFSYLFKLGISWKKKSMPYQVVYDLSIIRSFYQAFYGLLNELMFYVVLSGKKKKSGMCLDEGYRT